ncbi:MAG: acetate--CoA ligase alpha subunit [Candidatus Hodarchaeales archaeon]|jgi:acetyltransferase
MIDRNTRIEETSGSNLSAFFKATSVAVIGASKREGSVGYSIMNNIRNSNYQGKAYAVNPKAYEDGILGFPCYKDVSDIPGNLDLVVIAIPARFVPDVVEECGQRRDVEALIIISAGFKEVGHEGFLLEEKVMRIAKKYGMRILGPNTLGMIVTPIDLNASFASQSPLPGKIAFASQSGAFCTSMLDWSLQKGIGFSSFVSLGNKCTEVGLDETALLKYWLTDPETSLILFYLEGISKGPEFMKEAEKVTHVKPIIAIKSGTTAAGAKAISSHTGSLAGADAAYSSAFKQSGVIRADGAQQLFDYALAFNAYSHRLPKNDRIAIITNAGGPGIICTDEIEKNGLQLASFSLETIEELKKVLPPTANFYNPVDVIGDAPPSRFRDSIDVVLKDPGVDGIIVMVTPQDMTAPDELAPLIANRSAVTNKPIIAVMMGGSQLARAINYLNTHGVPAYPFPERAVTAMKGLYTHGVTYKKFRGDVIDKDYYVIDENKRQKITAIFDKVISEGRVNLTEFEAKKIVGAYDISVTKETIATTEDEAVRYSTDIGYPVVMKIVSPDILHKTDVGGVILNIKNENEASHAYSSILISSRRHVPDADIKGILVSEMINPDKKRQELIIGMSKDPQFGPNLMVGFGGIFVEVMKDVSFRIAPISRIDAETMLEEIKSYKLLMGYRGAPPNDVEDLIDVMMKISQLVNDWPQITEMDINPLFVYEKGYGTLALDVKITIHH